MCIALEEIARRCELTVAAHEHGYAHLSGRQGALQKKFQMPADAEHGVKSAAAQLRPDRGRVAPGKARRTGNLGDVRQEGMGVSRCKVDVPRKGRSKPCRALLFGGWRVREKDL